ncbi:MAG: lipopolysaccharide biosynthesis protein [Acidobacteria bacterium]|nr:lipopolysaccharide biosynthesis protein [Acidobacteriota bacterium]
MKSRLFRALRWQYAANLGVGGLGALYILFLARLLGAQGFGVYAVLTAIPTVVFNAFDFRSQEVLIYFHAQLGRDPRVNPSTIASMFVIDGVVRTTALLSSLLVALVVSSTMGLRIGIDTILLVCLTVFLAKVFSGPAMGLLRVRERLDFFVSLQFTDWTLRLTSLGLLVLTGTVSLNHVLITQCVCAGAINAVIFREAGREHVREFGRRLFLSMQNALPDARLHWRMLGANQGISIMDSVVKEADTIIVGYLLSVQASGLYKMAKNFAGIAWRAADPIYIVIMPILSQYWARDEHDALNSFVRKTTLVLTAASVMLYVGTCVGVNLVVPYFLGPEYQQSAAIYPLASFWIVVAMPLIWTHSLAISAGKPGLQAWAGAFGNLIGLAGLCVGALVIGLKGAAIGLSLAYMMPFVIACFLLHRAGVFAWK